MNRRELKLLIRIVIVFPKTNKYIVLYLDLFFGKLFYTVAVPLHYKWVHLSGQVYKRSFGFASVDSDNTRACVIFFPLTFLKYPMDDSS